MTPEDTREALVKRHIERLMLFLGYGSDIDDDLDAAVRAALAALQREEAADQLAAPVGEQGWQPIESAPQDGEDVILRLADGRVVHGSWERFDTSGRWVIGCEGFVVTSEPQEWQAWPR